MKITFWGTRGSLASPGPENLRYGGNTSCVEVRGTDGTLLVLDAGTGIRRLGDVLEPHLKRLDILITHLHFDHIQGLGFFEPLYRPDLNVHIWGPASTTVDFGSRLARDFSTTLFPVRLGDLPCRPVVHDVPLGTFRIGGLAVTASLVSHPGPTVGYRITENGTTIAYLPDHEPALGARDFPGDVEWLSGYELAVGADLLIHDAQFTDAEYAEHVGWGHSAFPHTLAFAAATGVKRLVTFHHDPSHSDSTLDRLIKEARERHPPFEILPGAEGTILQLAS